MGWRSWNIGDRIRWHIEDFDGATTLFGNVVEKHEDHLIVDTDDGQHLWVSDWNKEGFRKETIWK